MLSRTGILRGLGLAMMLLLCQPVVQGATIYVDASATGAASGVSWSDAYSNLQSALTAATSGDEIWVAKGTYTPGSDASATFQLIAGVGLYGGFTNTMSDKSQRNWVTNPTILSGDLNSDDNGLLNADDNTYQILQAASAAVLDGFIVQGGNARYPGGKSGAGLYIDGASMTIAHCLFKYNQSESNGGAIYNSESTTTISDSFFISNKTGSFGGVIYNFSSKDQGPTLTNCVFIGNDADSGGVMYSLSAMPKMINCTLVSNTASYGGAIRNSFSTPTLINCILWNNTASTSGDAINDSGSTSIVQYTLIQGDYDGTGNLSVDPLFVNLSDPDGTDDTFGTDDDGLALQAGSPAIQTGIASSAPAADILGNSRGSGQAVDMGAYTTDSATSGDSGGTTTTTPQLQVTPASGTAPVSVTFTANIPGSPKKYDWDFDGNGIVDAVSFTSSITHTYTEAGSFTASVAAFVAESGILKAETTVVIEQPANPPQVTLAANVSQGTAPLSVTFTATATSSTQITQYEWDFDGDGAADQVTSTNSVTHVYDASATYMPTVRVTDSQGLTAVSTATSILVSTPETMEVVLFTPIDGADISGSAVSVGAKVIGNTTATALEVQYRQKDTTTWTSINGATLSASNEWLISWNTSSLTTSTEYELRAVARDNSSTTFTSSTVSVRVVAQAQADVVETVESGQHIRQQKVDHTKTNRINVGSNISISIPYGTLAASGTIAVAAPSEWSTAARMRLRTGSGITGVELSSPDLTLSNNLSIALSYVDADGDNRIDSDNTPVSDLKAYYQADENSAWEEVPIESIKTSTKQIIVNDSRLGQYVISTTTPSDTTLAVSLSSSDPVVTAGEAFAVSVKVTGTVPSDAALYVAADAFGTLYFAPTWGTGITVFHATPVSDSTYEVINLPAAASVLPAGTYRIYAAMLTPALEFKTELATLNMTIQ